MTDADRLRDMLATIATDYEDALTPVATANAGKGKEANKAGSRPPLPTESMHLRLEVHDFLHSWWRHTGEWWDGWPESFRIPTAIAYFDRHADEMVKVDVILDEMVPLGHLVRLLHLAAGETEDCAERGCIHPRPKLPSIGSCPLCTFGEVMPEVDDGKQASGMARCSRTCGNGEAHPLWWWWAVQTGCDPADVAPLSGLADASGVSRNVIDQRLFHGQIERPSNGLYNVWQIAYYAATKWPPRKDRHAA